MNRRSFLKISGISAALVAIPGVSILYGSTRTCAVELILKEFSFLKINPDDVEKYVDDFYAYFPQTESTSWQMKIKARYYFNVESSSSTMLVNGFLTGSDFFYNKMDENREIKYMGLYNEYTRPCANPFSHLFYPQQEEVV